jgi:hypothetical protein
MRESGSRSIRIVQCEMSLDVGSDSNARRAWRGKSIPMRGEPEGGEKCSMLLVNAIYDERHQEAHAGRHRVVPGGQSRTGVHSEVRGGLPVHRRRTEPATLQQVGAEGQRIDPAISHKGHRPEPGPGDEVSQALDGVPRGAEKAGAASEFPSKVYAGRYRPAGGTCWCGRIKFITSPTMCGWRGSRSHTSTT